MQKNDFGLHNNALQGTEASSKDRIQDIWGLAVVVLLFPITWFALTEVIRSYPNKLDMTYWLWVSYLVMQIVNRIPLGYKWINDMPHNIERTLFLYGMLVTLNYVYDFISINNNFWAFSALLMSIWIIMLFYRSLNESKDEYPIKNRIVGAASGAFVNLPILSVCLIGFATSA